MDWEKVQNDKRRGIEHPASWTEIPPGLRNLVVGTIDTKLMALEMSGTTPDVVEAFLVARQALELNGRPVA